MKTDRIPRFLVEQYALGELSPELEAALRKRIHNQTQLDQLVAELELENNAFFEEIDTTRELERVEHKIHTKTENHSIPSVTKKITRFPSRKNRLGWTILAAAAGFILVFGIVLFVTGSLTNYGNNTQEASRATFIQTAPGDSIQELLVQMNQDPENKEILNQLGIMYAERDHWEEAERHFKKAVDIDRTYFPAAFNLARIYLHQEKIDQANEILQLCKELEPDNVQVYMALAYVYEKGTPNQNQIRRF
jgi:cytochrome c-type biogenesis protein CcmH/NrfG